MADSGVVLNWANKDKTLVARSERDYEWRCDGVESKPLVTIAKIGNAEPNSNLVVCGDGLDALGAMSAADMIKPGTVRLVYIDPPFNTGRAFGDYGDSLDSAMWLSLLRDRLEAVKPFLSADASVWVHLDDSENHRARCVLDEVFGSDAFVTNIVWQKRTTRESRSAFSTNHDHLMVYAPAGPRAWKKRRNLLAKDASELQNRDQDPRGPWADAPFTAPGYRANQQYDIVNPAGRVLRPPRGRSWYATEPTYLQLLQEDRIWFPRNGAGNPRLKLFAHQIRGLVPFSVWGATETGTNDDAKRHLQTLFPGIENVFATPKPEELLERIIHISTDPGELVVDLFSGSGTTAAAAHKMGRRWIAVERSVATVQKILTPRMSAVVNGDDPGGISSQCDWIGGGGFTVTQAKPALGRVRAVRLAATDTARGAAARKTRKPPAGRAVG
ncbi:site-specific DNA-methyltransferase [Mycobacteroides abscessus]|uniref:site-specific DNA-methyltransferase n=1 Tax=Mycobacteroides abscessus TaxID=36809 RepID=UPI0002E40A5B|nr:site-specific DNA-methyltransferase [Mycobacteroides abscessus]RRE00744.1 site-specific DNA-methyltransferase [Mycobacteroides abscessus subsp. massiliense]SKR65043.1 adenine specific DNA methylase Mod [Mycobacteroides abscessus subsp. abscessus]